MDCEGILNGLGEKMIELLDSNKMKEPWFFFTHAEDLHFPLAVPKEFDNEKFGDSPYERVLSALDQWIGNFLEKIERSLHRNLSQRKHRYFHGGTLPQRFHCGHRPRRF